MSEAVTVPSLMMMTSTISEELLARNTHTHTHGHTWTHTHTQMYAHRHTDTHTHSLSSTINLQKQKHIFCILHWLFVEFGE